MSCSKNKMNFDAALKSITDKDLRYYVENLASDEFEGRKPFSRGEKLTLDFIESEMTRTGLEPAFSTGFLQEVPLVEITSVIPEKVSMMIHNREFHLNFPDEIAIESQRISETIEVRNSQFVFAGFGIVAPEYDWNDYKNLDVRGKTVVVFVNDPGLYTEDEKLFKGKTMTYYGRWTYKYEEAARQGAEGILIIHETLGAGYTYAIPRKSALGSSFYINDKNNYADKCAFQGWISAEAATSVFAEIKLDPEVLRKEACKRGFKGFEMPFSINMSIRNEISKNISHNVAGMIHGSRHPDECIVYSAHWDHFGIGEAENGDSIYNGAVDNGTSLAWMMEIAEAFTKLKQKPERSILFLAPTAEEQGLLGSAWYVENPAITMEKTLACLNNDLLLPIGRMRDVMVTGYGQSELDELVEKIAIKQGRYIYPDPNAHTGMYFRSDHFSFAKKGVPSLFVRGNCDSREHGKEWAAEQERDYLENRYHRPADNYDPDLWNMEGIIEDAKLAFEIGYILSFADDFPKWKEGSEFNHIRNTD